MSYYGSDNELTCGCYLAAPLPWCVRRIVLSQLPLIPMNGEIIDHHNNRQYVHIENGIIDLDNPLNDSIPKGYFSPFGGSYKFRALFVDDYEDPFRFIFGVETFDCISLRFIHTSPVVEEAVVI